MPENKDGPERPGFVAFWTSLPGILTGVAAVIAAVATLAALFVGNEGTESQAPRASAPSASKAGPSPGGGSCFGRYFDAIPRDRIAPVEAGTTAFDVIGANQPKAGTVGLRLTNNGRSIGGVRFAFFPTNEIFKIESVVDERCRPIEEYSNTTNRGGDPHVLQNADAVRFGLGGAFYDLTLNGTATIRLVFVSVVP